MNNTFGLNIEVNVQDPIEWITTNNTTYLPTGEELTERLVSRLVHKAGHEERYFLNTYVRDLVLAFISQNPLPLVEEIMVHKFYGYSKPAVVAPNPKEGIDMLQLGVISQVNEVQFRLDDTQEWESEAYFLTKREAVDYIQTISTTINGEFQMVIAHNVHKEDIMKGQIYTFLLMPGKYQEPKQGQDRFMPFIEGGGQVVITTDSPLPSEMESIAVFEKHLQNIEPLQADVEQMRRELPRLEVVPTASNWVYPTLKARVTDQGGTFRLEAYSQVADAAYNYVTHRSNRASFSFSKEGDTNVLFVRDADGNFVEWDNFQGYMGLVFRVTDEGVATKFGKRAAEIVRETNNYAIFTDGAPLHVHTVEFDEDKEIAVDGNACMSVSGFLKFNTHLSEDERAEFIKRVGDSSIDNGIVRVNFRYLFELGIIKGDIIVTPDEVVMAEYGFVPDMVQPTINGEMVNLKKEISTDGAWATLTSTPHHAHHLPMTNVQLLTSVSKGMTWLFTPEEMLEDYTKFVNLALDEVKSGKFPAFMEADWASSSKGRSGMVGDPEGLSAQLGELSQRWFAHRTMFSDSPLMESGMLIKMNGTGFYNRLSKNLVGNIKAPLRHAAYVHITTLSIIKMCGFNPAEEGYDTSKSFYHQKSYSWVAPDDVFKANYDRHGGYDGDDSMIVAIRNVEFEDGTVRVMAIQLRFPMSLGEWAMVEVDTKDFPFYNTWHDMPTVKYADRPIFLEDIGTGENLPQDMPGIPEDDSEPFMEYSKEWAAYQVELACANPGVGRVVNKMMSFYSMTDTYFPRQVDSTENMIDHMQQNGHKKGYTAITEGIDDMVKQIMDSPLPLDRFIARTRLEGYDIPDSKLYDGPYYKLHRKFTDITNAYKTEVDRISKEDRLRIGGTELESMNLPETIQFLEEDGTVVEANTKEKAISMYEAFRKDNAKYGSIHGDRAEFRRRFSSEVNDRWVMKFLEQPSKVTLLLAIYQFYISTNETDNIFFMTPLRKGDVSTMDVFLRALHNKGLAVKIAEDGTFSWLEELA